MSKEQKQDKSKKPAASTAPKGAKQAEMKQQRKTPANKK